MARIVPPDPFGSFLQGRQVRQQEDYTNTRNALARMELENAPAEMQRRNKLADMQVEGTRQQLDSEKARIAHAQLSQALQSGNPKAFVLQNIPDLARHLQAKGVDLNSMDDESAGTVIQDMARQLAGSAGVMPAAPEAFTLKPGEARYRGTEVVASRPVIQKPASSEPLYQVAGPDGKTTYVPRSQAQGMSPPQPSREGQDFMRADKLRDEYNAASKDFIAIGDNYMRVREAARDPSAAGDLSLIFAYMKMLDPSSVVREQEFANAQNAAGVPDRIRNAWNKALNGERLNPNQRQDFINQANKVYKAQSSRHESTVKARYKQMATRFGVDPENVVGAFDVPDADSGRAAPAAPPQPQHEITATGPNGQKIVLRNGQWVPM